MLRRRELLLAAGPLFGQWPEEQSPVNERGRQLAAIAKSLRIRRGLEYARRPERPLTLDVYAPAKVSQPLPAILCFGLAAWAKDESAYRVNLDKLLAAPTLNIYPPAIVPQGYVVVSAQLRTSAEVRFPGQLEDCRSALRYVIDHARDLGIDPNRIALMGASASGHLVSLLALRDRPRLRAVCCFAGMYDFELFDRGKDEGNLRPRVEALLGPKSDLWRTASPAHYVHRGAPPFFLMHGSSDNRVPYEQAIEFHRALAKAKVSVEFMTLRDYGHGPLPNKPSTPGYEEVDARVERFFHENLKP